MSNGAIIATVVGVLVVLAALLVFGTARRRETDEATGALSRETRKRDKSDPPELVTVGAKPTGREVERGAELERLTPSTDIVVATSTAPVPWVPPDPETLGATRRQFLNRGIVNMMSFTLAAFGLACIGFLWPQAKGGFGSKIKVGPISDILANIKASSGFAYYPAGRMWITAYPASALDKAKQVKSYDALIPGMEAGVVALYQKCVHLGCRVPACLTSQWFECPCHGSKYNRVGEKKGGPAPRGLDHFLMIVESGSLTVDTGNIILGPPIGTNTTGQEAEGPHCVSAGGHG
jgi:cytochrome b6-f complex iron-sulfur subunit